jgi:hypothetical protein
MITAIRGGWRDQDGRGVYLSESDRAAWLVVGQQDGDSLRFALRVDPDARSVVIQDAT